LRVPPRGRPPFREGLLSSLADLGLAYQEAVAGFGLLSINDTLQVSVQGWMGTAQLKMKSRGHGRDLGDIVSHLRSRPEGLPGAISLSAPAIYGVMGLVMAAFGVHLILEF
jgi:hypothetical protein